MRSLRTSCPREAARRARAMWLATERVFALVASRKSLEREHIELILRRLIEESVWDSPSTQEILDGFRAGDIPTMDRLFGDVGSEAILALPPNEQEVVRQHLERMLDKVSVDVGAGEAKAAGLAAEVATLRQLTAEIQAVQAHTATLKSANDTMAAVGKAQISAPQARPPPEERDIAPLLADAATKRPGGRRDASIPRISAVWPEFIAEKTQSHDGHTGYSPHTAKQADATFQLFVELIGDKAVDRISGIDAQQFRKLLLRLPSSHGKTNAAKGGANWLSPMEEIQRADRRQAAIDARNKALPEGQIPERALRRVKLKTVKRHFSTLAQCWDFLKTLGHLKENVFAGFKYPGTKSSKSQRSQWSDADLNKLLASDWFAAGSRTNYKWMTAIAMFTGMRLEEIARLRCVDVQVDAGIPYFDIAEQPDGWTPKTEAGVRIVPIHPFLLELGLMEYVAARREEQSHRVFPGLVPYGPDRKLSGDLSRSFSRKKIALGIEEKTVFHSFRHSVRTILTNRPAPEYRDAWVDALIGHSSEDERTNEHGTRVGISTGERIYNKGILVRNLLTVVKAIEYPDEVDLHPIRLGLGHHPK
jgi:integrase